MRDAQAPVKILAIEIDEENIVVTKDGHLRHDSMVILDPEDVGRMHAGYVCARCMDVQPGGVSFPEECATCGFPMKEKQAEFLANGYRGEVRVGPSTSLEDELAFMDEWEEIQKRQQRDEILRPSQILLPGRDF